MGKYGLTNNPLAVIAVEVTFATPYAIFIFQQYGASIPFELDEAARIDGASPPQIFFRIYLPLMAPALVAIGSVAARGRYAGCPSHWAAGWRWNSLARSGSY